MIFFFSGTGNSEWVASEISNALNEKRFNIAKELQKPVNDYSYTLKENEKIGFVFPVYSWAPPKIVLEFIEKVNFLNYQQQYLFFVCSCGDDTGLTKEVFIKATGKRGWNCDAGYSIIMPNNYVLLKGFNTDPKEVEKQKLQDAIPAIKTINNSLLDNATNDFKCKEGSFPFIKTRVINLLFNKYAITSKPFFATDNCISCGLCEKKCPTNNVKVDEKPSWGNNCTSCLACYHFCPTNAVQYGKATKKKGQYMNPNV